MSDETDPLDALLASGLALPERGPDPAFVARIDALVAEQQRYLRWRAALVRRLLVELLGIGALAASLLVLAEVPDVRNALTEAPLVAWPALAALVLLWVVTRGGSAPRLVSPAPSL